MFEDYNLNDTEYINECVDFIEDVLKERDWSHGVEHCKQVAKNSVEIWFSGENEKYESVENKQDLEVDPVTIIIFASLLHDVLDHKYSKYMPLDVPSKMDNIINMLGKNASKIVKKVIKNISYSNELKNGIEKMDPCVLILRNVVSDADKIEALGEIGIHRCVSYQHEIGEGKTDEEILETANKHIKGRLLKIYPEFLHTDLGLKIGKERSEFLRNKFS